MRAGSKAAFIGLSACMALVLFVSAMRATEVVRRPPALASVAAAPVQPSLVTIHSAEAPAEKRQSADAGAH